VRARTGAAHTVSFVMEGGKRQGGDRAAMMARRRPVSLDQNAKRTPNRMLRSK
jgi:hypothetical protein